MARGTPDDPYVLPGTDVLRNNLGLRSASSLQKAEVALTGDRLVALQRSPLKGTFDISHYADTHHAIFKDVYPWAGEFRTIELHKWSEQRQDFTSFMPAEVIVPWLNRHLNEHVVKRDSFRQLGPDEFIQRSTQLYLDLNAFHPFREGNGRTQREFIRTLGLNAGFDIDWNRLDKEQLLDATIRTAYDRTKTDRSLHDQVAKALVTPTKDLALQAAWDRYIAGAEFQPPLAPTQQPPHATLPDAIRASTQAARGPVAFVSADWEKQARIRVYTPNALVETLSKVASAAGPPVYAVHENGTVHNTATRRDEYLRLEAGRTDYPPQLQQAAERHFGKSPDLDQPAHGHGPRDPDVEGP